MMRTLALAGLALSVSTQAHARIDASSFSSLSFRQHPGAQLPLRAQLRDDKGRVVTLSDELGGRASVLVLEYLRCQNLCSLVLSGATAAMIRAHLTPGEDVNLVAVSIDPRDTSSDAAASAAMYSRRFPDSAAAARGIHFLTGSPDQIARIAQAVGFPYKLDRQSGQYAHPAGFVVTTPEGRISRYMLGLNQPASALRNAVAEASQGAVTPPAHPLLLLCFGYDPDAGTAAALAMRLVRYVYLAALITCGLLIGGFWLKRRTA
jgi:protein SCO1/2